MEKLLKCVSNWGQKNGRQADEGELFISKIYVDESVTLKRLRPGAKEGKRL